MFLPAATLDHFVQSVPFCEETVSLSELLLLFQSSQNQEIVIINDEQKPLGIISCYRLVCWLLQQEYKNLGNWQSLQEAIDILPGQMTLEEFQSSLFSEGEKVYGVVNKQGNFLGLLDFGSLLQFLTNDPNIWLSELTEDSEGQDLSYSWQQIREKKADYRSLYFPKITRTLGSLDQYILEQKNLNLRLDFPQVFPLKDPPKFLADLAEQRLNLLTLNQIKTEILSYISHEVKSPLTAIAGLSSLLKTQKLGSLNEKQARYAELINRNSRQLISLVNDLLDLNRLETGNIILNIKTLNLQKTCHEIQEYINKNNDKNLNFFLENHTEISEIQADKLRLRQMLHNLLDNAIKFTPCNGQIGLRLEQWGNWLALTVWDTGVGIPQDYQHLIFQDFSSRKISFNSKWEGTGLGLAVTQGLAELHLGNISFTSQLGKGSEFTVLLPILPREFTRKKTRENNLIIIVETVVEYINQWKNYLKKLNYEVIIARQGIEALKKIQIFQPKAVIINPLLPLISGWDLFMRLKSDDFSKNIPIIVTGSEIDRKKAEEYGTSYFLTLPPEEKSLREIFGKASLERHLNKQKLTILCLHPDTKQTGWVATMVNNLLEMGIEDKIHYRIVQADDLEQGETIAKVWTIDVIIIDGTVEKEEYLQSLALCDTLASLPLITLDSKTTEFANKFSNLRIFPCFITPGEEGLASLWEVVQIVLPNAD